MGNKNFNLSMPERVYAFIHEIYFEKKKKSFLKIQKQKGKKIFYRIQILFIYLFSGFFFPLNVIIPIYLSVSLMETD